MKDSSIKEYIKRAFLEIYKEKPIEQIKINEIIEKAHIGRSTFYKYYKNIYDLQKSIEASVFLDMKNIYDEHNYLDVMVLPENAPAPNFYETYKYVYKHKDFFEPALSDHGNYLFKKETKKNITEKLRLTYKKYFDEDIELDAFVDYVSELVISTCKVILKHHDILDAKTLSIKTKKSIFDFIKNKDIYFKKSGI